MSAYKILNEDWSEYEERKKEREDRFFITCEEAWEVHYVIKKIRKHHPHITTEELKNAIEISCRQISVPRPRPLFVQCVLRKFGIV